MEWFQKMSNQALGFLVKRKHWKGNQMQHKTEFYKEQMFRMKYLNLCILVQAWTDDMYRKSFKFLIFKCSAHVVLFTLIVLSILQGPLLHQRYKWNKDLFLTLISLGLSGRKGPRHLPPSFPKEVQMGGTGSKTTGQLIH